MTSEEMLEAIVTAMNWEFDLSQLDEQGEEGRLLGGQIFNDLLPVCLSAIVGEDHDLEEVMAELCNDYIYESDSFDARGVRNFLKPYLK